MQTRVSRDDESRKVFGLFCSATLLKACGRKKDLCEATIGNMDPNRDDLDYQLNQDKLNNR